MRSHQQLSQARGFALAAIAIFAIATNTTGQTEKVLYSFQAGTQGGSGPESALVADSAGNFYGTNFYGGTVKGANGACSDDGTYGCGTAFELSPSARGGYTEKVLRNFGDSGDGANPAAALISDAAGNLYGTTAGGGSKGCGTVFELIHPKSGAWREQILYSFCSLPEEADGSYPYGGLIFDKAGNLYGTASEGGTGPCGCAGVVFELSLKQGVWTEHVLHNFGSEGDGTNPVAGLVFDQAGNLYGTTGIGGSSCNFNHGCGAVFELSPQSANTWTEKVLYIFTGSYGDTVAEPNSTPILDAAGNLYGTTAYAPGAFELTPNSDGSWSQNDLPAPCCFPNALIMDSTGNLYATAASDTGGSCCGSVFELAPQAGGGWTETTLLTFPSSGKRGAIPLAGLIFDSEGNLYGTTSQGGSFWHVGAQAPAGTVFEITLVPTETADR
jgi:hypothetical protein